MVARDADFNRRARTGRRVMLRRSIRRVAKKMPKVP
jgi:hypothetical protein